MQPLVALTRSGRIESIHRGHICVSDSQGHIVFCSGEPDTDIYMRSSAKPIQALALVKSGALEKYDITEQELAVICSSHSGEEFHRKAVSSILKKAGLSEANLDCGVANPYNEDMLRDLIRKGRRPSQLYNCCSGKHAGMLALCSYSGFPVEGYTAKDHPVQRLILNTVCELLSCDPENTTTGVDGCGVPTIMVSLSQASYLYSLLAQGQRGSTRFAPSFERIRKAMAGNPQMINGDREFCTDLIYHTGGRIIGKVGAEGIYCAAIPERQLGICIKISDGNERGVYPVMICLLQQLGLLDEETLEKLQQWAAPPVKNHKGAVAGYTVPVFHLEQEPASLRIGETLNFGG